MDMSTETKVLIGVLAATILIIVGGAYLSGSGQSGDGEPVHQPERLVRDESPVLGPDDAKVTVVEFGDFQCPACGALHPVLKQIKEDNKDNSVKFVYRHFPLPQHQFAQLASEASIEAQQQGKFFEYHDALFENQDALEREDLERYAQELELDMDSLRKALDDKIHKDVVSRDEQDARALGVSGTPTVYINGVKYSGQYSISGIQAEIDGFFSE